MGDSHKGCLNLCAGRFSHCCGPKHVEQSPYVRVSFASASHEELRQGMERLGVTLRAAQAAQGLAGSHASAKAATADGTASLPAFAAAAAAQPAADSDSATSQGASLPAAGQNGHASSAAQKPSGQSQGGMENGHTGDMANGYSAGSASNGAGGNVPGLRVDEDAGKGARRVNPFPDGAAKVELAPGSLGVTADALAPRLAKTLDPRDSAWKH